VHVTACEDEFVCVLKPADVGLRDDHGAVFIVHFEVSVDMQQIVVNPDVWFLICATKSTFIRADIGSGLARIVIRKEFQEVRKFLDEFQIKCRL